MLATAAVAWSVKLHYSGATVSELAWILRPTAALVSWLTGLPFDFENDLGFVNRSIAFAIAKPCAGVNFAIIAFVMLAFTAKRMPLLLCAAAAYVVTLLVNATRISLSVWRLQSPATTSLMSAEQLHRLEGVVIYFVALLALYLLVARRHAVWIPLSFYLVGTLVVPLLNGARLGGHTVTVLGVSCVIALCAYLMKRLTPERGQD